ncbi:MAG TPA: P22 phage major capsid protein family protein [Nocardioidaceae bacterium]|nr:P22 phage major capsid protein family protein [Nocardioidaceae bacterium]
MSDFIKVEKVVRTALGLLEREVVLPRLVWRDAAGDFRGAKDDTISIRLPAYGVANTRALRSGDARTKSSLHERKVDVTLDTDVYMDVPITDEELTLDIEDFGGQVLAPVVSAVARGLEDDLVSTITGATYAHDIALDMNDLKGTFAEARQLLNKSRVPAGGRTLLIGSEVDSALIQLDNLVRYDQSNTTETLREASIGRVYGFNVVVSNEIDPGDAYAFHNTAYVLNSRAPVVPAGAPWGASQSFAGFAIRTVRVFDPDAVEDRFIADSWVGSNIVTDQGAFDGNGAWTPVENPADNGSDAQFIRAVKLSGTES